MADLLPGELATAPADRTVLILDPPAEGLPANGAPGGAGNPPAGVIYVSCNPATLARDLAVLREGYEMVSVTPLDMFPQTAEIEAVASLRRKA